MERAIATRPELKALLFSSSLPMTPSVGVMCQVQMLSHSHWASARQLSQI